MLLQVYNSKRDKYGNCYWGIVLTDNDFNESKIGTIGCNNISTIDCRENLKIHVVYQELSIREFNRKFKNVEYFGSNWEDIKSKLFE